MIRAACLQDLEEIIMIEATCFPLAEAASKVALKERIEAFQKSFYVIEIDNKIAGFINGCISDIDTIQDEAYESISYHNPNGKYQMVFGLDVLPQFQHLGYAKALMNHLLSSAKNNGQIGVVLTCKKELIGFYEQFGFINQGISASTHGQVIWYDMSLIF